MADHSSRTRSTEQVDFQRFEDYPLTRSEYISAMVHLYRGEQYRAQIWRTRLDITTNWAVLSIGALLSWVFTREDNTHFVVILGMYMIFIMLMFEARRFRFYDVWRNRVRRIEENFYVPILRRDLTSPMENWGFYVADDLLVPRYKISKLMAIKARLLNNYAALFLILLAAWAFKAQNYSHSSSLAEFYRGLGVKVAPPWLMIAAVGTLYGFLLYVLIFVRRLERPEHIYFGTRGTSIDDVG